MKDIIIIDSHCDTIKKCFDEKIDITNPKLKFSLQQALKKGKYIQIVASYITPELTNIIGGYEIANKLIDEVYKQYKKHKDKMFIIKQKDDFEKVINSNKLGIILSIENGSAISGKLENIDKLYEKGIRMMSITHNSDNELGCGVSTKNDKGLTILGKEYIKKLLNKNIAIDISHVSEKSFYDVVKISNKPIIASHSNVKAIYNHKRNLSEEQIKLIAKSGGYIGICYCSEFLSEKTATVKDLVRHIDYIAQLVGIDYIGLGSDFDGIDDYTIMEDIKTVKEINLIFEELKSKGYKKEDIEKIAGKNALRVLKKIIK